MFPIVFVLSLIAQYCAYRFGPEKFVEYALVEALLLYPLAVLASVVLSVVPALLRGSPAAFGWFGSLGGCCD
jgi:hypothetical protein